MSDSARTDSSLPDRFYSISYKNDGILDRGAMKVKVTFHHNVDDAREIDLYLEDIMTMYAKNKPFSILYNASGVSAANPKHLQRLGAFMDTKEDESKRLIIACAVVLPNPAVRTLVKTIVLFKESSSPLSICKNVPEAHKFLQRFETDPHA